MMMTVWFMRGMAEDAHLGASQRLFGACLDSWIDTIEHHLRGDDIARDDRAAGARRLTSASAARCRPTRGTGDGVVMAMRGA